MRGSSAATASAVGLCGDSRGGLYHFFLLYHDKVFGRAGPKQERHPRQNTNDTEHFDRTHGNPPKLNALA
jgi:hypothetical protein